MKIPKNKTLHNTVQNPQYNIIVNPALGIKMMINLKTIPYGGWTFMGLALERMQEQECGYTILK